MRTIFDASSLINAVHGEIIERVASLTEIDLCFGPQVQRECSSISRELAELASKRNSVLVDDSDIPASLYVTYHSRYGLGPGETECITIAYHKGWRVSCDDGLARRMITKELGEPRLTGSIGLLRRLVAGRLMTADEATEAYRLMLDRGAFLPALSPEWIAPEAT